MALFRSLPRRNTLERDAQLRLLRGIGPSHNVVISTSRRQPTRLLIQIIPEAYDADGRKVFRPDSRRKSGFRPTFPVGRFVSQPLNYVCTDLAGVRRFLLGCKYVSDQEQFGQGDYWQAPELFEESKRGDCDDFALWTWRQLLAMNYKDARFVVGTSGRYGAGHAWVTVEKDGAHYIVESFAAPWGLKLPRLSGIRYRPSFSIGLDGDKISYYEHTPKRFTPSFAGGVSLFGEWFYFWLRFWPKLAYLLVRGVAKKSFATRPRTT